MVAMLEKGEGLGMACGSEVEVNNILGYICALFHAILPAYLYILTNVHFLQPNGYETPSSHTFRHTDTPYTE